MNKETNDLLIKCPEQSCNEVFRQIKNCLHFREGYILTLDSKNKRAEGLEIWNNHSNCYFCTMGKKQDILNAALKLLVQKGIHATPMSAVAKEAGTGMGTIYNHFPNKDMLINTLYINIKIAEKEVFKTFNARKSLKTQFEKYYLSAIQFYLDHPLYFHFIEQIQASPIISKESKVIAYQSITEVLELIEKGKKESVIKNIETNDLMQFIGGTIISFLRVYFEENRQERSFFKNQIKLVWDAIKK